MAGRRLLDEIRNALEEHIENEEDAEIESWGRRVVFDFKAPRAELWRAIGCDKPPRAFTLMVRVSDGAHEMVWQRREGASLDDCPIVDLTPDGEANVLAPNAQTWFDALLLSCGALGGGAADDLERAAEEATRAARSLSEELQDEFERDLPDPADLGDIFDELQDALQDAWVVAAEGLE